MNRTRSARTDLPGSRVAAVAFTVVIIGTALSFALAQRLKREPPLVDPDRVQRLALFSPELESGAARGRFSFYLRKDEVGTLIVTNLAGDPVRTLQKDLEIRAGKQVKGSWNGADDRGRPLPDGRYRVQVVLQRSGRSVLLPFTFTKDTTPPEPKLLSIGPEKTGATPRPELLPRADGKPIKVRFRVSGRSKGIAVIRTDLARPRVVLDVPIAENQVDWEWDGTIEGRRAAQGTYVIAVHAKDLVGNEGWSTGTADPIAPFGGRLEGQGGVTVRYLAAQSSQAPVAAGERAEVGIISAGKPYDWSIRRVGEKRPRSEGTSRKPVLKPRLPSGPSGLHVLEVQTADRTAQATILTQGRKPQSVLVVVPQGSLTGAQLVDDDGDGAPDTLDRGVSVATARVPVDADLPTDLTDRIAPLLLSLDRKQRRYDLTTDLALARGQGPEIAGHDGIVLAGTTTYLDAKVQRRLSTWVKRGGRLWIAEPSSLQRSMAVTAGAMTEPTQPAPLDPFGFRLGPLQEVSSVEVSADRARLLRGTDGRFEGPLTVEPVLRNPTGSGLLAEATTPGGGQAVLSAVRLGRGAVVRSGIAGLGASSLRDPDAREFLRSLWAFLRGG